MKCLTGHFDIEWYLKSITNIILLISISLKADIILAAYLGICK